MRQGLISSGAGGGRLDLLRHSSIYFAGDLAVKALFLVSIPVYTRLMSTADYGLFQVFQTFVALGVALLTLNFHGAIVRYRFENSDDFPAFVGTSLAGSLLLLSTSFLALAIFADAVSIRLGIPTSLLGFLYPATFLMALFLTYQGVCVSSKRSASLTTLSTARAYVAFAAGVALIFVFPDRPFLGPVLGGIVASAVVGLVIVRRLLPDVRWAPRVAHVRYILGFATPLALYTLSTIFLGQLDRVMINKLEGSSEAGLYSLAYNVGMLVEAAAAAMQLALIPDYFKLMNEQQYARADGLIDFVFKLTLVVALGIALFSSEIFSILAARDYHAALPIIPVVVVGYVFNALFKVYIRDISYHKRMGYLALISIAGSLLNFVLNLKYIPRHGYVAGAYTTLASFAFMFGLTWIVARYRLKLDLVPLGLLLRPTAVFGVSMAGYYWIASSGMGTATALLAKSALLALFCGVLVWMKPGRTRADTVAP